MKLLIVLIFCSLPFFSIAQNIANLHFEMVRVNSGRITLGADDPEDDEFPSTLTFVQAFHIGKYEVTQAQWTAVMGSNPSYHQNCNSCPVENISWNDVQLFMRTLNKRTKKRYRLPTEFEWEYAARGGAQTKNYRFSGNDIADSVAWTFTLGETMPVGQKIPNELGLYDMTGNVAEFTSSNLTDNTDDYKVNGGYLKIIRGCTCASGYINKTCKLSYRGNVRPHLKNFLNGFRLVLDEQK